MERPSSVAGLAAPCWELNGVAVSSAGSLLGNLDESSRESSAGHRCQETEKVPVPDTHQMVSWELGVGANAKANLSCYAAVPPLVRSSWYDA